MSANPEMDVLREKLDAVRLEQSTLFRKQRSTGLTANDHRRLAELGRTEIALMNSKRDTGRRMLGQKHRR